MNVYVIGSNHQYEEIRNKINNEHLGKNSEGYSGADIALICREALMTPIREMDVAGILNDKNLNPRNPNMEDFKNALKRIKPSVSPKELISYDKWNEQFGT